MAEPATLVLASPDVLPLLTGRLELADAALAALAEAGRVRAVVLHEDEEIPIAELEPVLADVPWRVAAVACDGPRHPGRARYRAVFARLRAMTGADDAPCPACGGSGWLPAGPAAEGVLLRAAAFRMWRGVPLPIPDAALQERAARDIVESFLSTGSPPPGPTERPPGARPGNGPGATFSATIPATAAPEVAPPSPGPGAGTAGEEEV